jgi:hypothetical protein
MLVLALGVVVVFLSGFALSRRGTPYNIVLVTAHKLTALSSVVLLTLALTSPLKSEPVAWPVWTLAGITTASVVALFASGALLSSSRPRGPAWRQIHRIAPYLALGTGLALVLLTAGSA